MESTDTQLLDQHRRGEPGAFAQLVRRHINWVYSAARRKTADAHLAEDITQAVFIVLAQSPPARLNSAALSPWLFGVLIRTCKTTLRAEAIRRRHESEAAKMRPTTTDPQADWNSIAPNLEDAVAKLRFADQQAILLRFYEQLSFAEVGAMLGITEEAARKRVSRATEKLRGVLQPVGASMSATSLSTILLLEVATPAPATMLAHLSTNGWATASTAANGAKGWIAIMAYAKTKASVAVGIVLVLLTAAGVGVTTRRKSPEAPVAVSPLIASSQQSNDTVVAVQRAEPSPEIRAILGEMQKSREKVRDISYELVEDVTFNRTPAEDAERSANGRFRRIHQVTSILRQANSLSARLVSRRFYDDATQDHVWDQRFVMTDHYAAEFTAGNMAQAFQTELRSKSDLDENLFYSNYSLIQNFFDIPYFGSVEHLPIRYELSLVSDPKKSPPGLIRITLASKGLTGELVIDPSKGYLVKESVRRYPDGRIMDRYLVDIKEIAPETWFPGSIHEQNGQLKSTSITTATEIKLRPEIAPDAFDPLKALNLPNGTWLRRRDLAGKTLNFRIRDGQPVPLADEELGQQPILPEEP